MDSEKIESKWSQAIMERFPEYQFDVEAHRSFMDRMTKVLEQADEGQAFNDLQLLASDMSEFLSCNSSSLISMLSESFSIKPISIDQAKFFLDEKSKERLNDIISVREESDEIDPHDPDLYEMMMSIELDVMLAELSNDNFYQEMAILKAFSDLGCINAMYKLGVKLHPWSKREHCNDVMILPALIDNELSEKYLKVALSYYERKCLDADPETSSLVKNDSFKELIGKIHAYLANLKREKGYESDDDFNQAFYHLISGLQLGISWCAKPAIELIIHPKSPISFTKETIGKILRLGVKFKCPWSDKINANFNQTHDAYLALEGENVNSEVYESSRDQALIVTLCKELWKESSLMADMYAGMKLSPHESLRDHEGAMNIARYSMGKGDRYYLAAMTVANGLIKDKKYGNECLRIIQKLAEMGYKEAYLNYGINLFHRGEWLKAARYMIKGTKYLKDDLDNNSRSKAYLMISESYLNSNDESYRSDAINFMKIAFNLGFVTAGYNLASYYNYLEMKQDSYFFVKQVLFQLDREFKSVSPSHPYDDLDEIKRLTFNLYTDLRDFVGEDLSGLDDDMTKELKAVCDKQAKSSSSKVKRGSKIVNLFDNSNQLH